MAMSAFTAGSLQPELPALGRMVLFLLKLSGFLGPELSEAQGKDVFSKVTVRTFGCLLYKPFHKAVQEKVKAEHAWVIPC